MSTERTESKKGRRFAKNKKKSNEKKTIAILIILLLILVAIGVGAFISLNKIKPEKQEEKNKTEIIKEISGPILEEKQYKEMKIKDISLKIENGASYFKCNIENITGKKSAQENIFVVFVKEDNAELGKFKYNLSEIEKNSTEEINIITTTDLKEAYNFYIEEDK